MVCSFRLCLVIVFATILVLTTFILSENVHARVFEQEGNPDEPLSPCDLAEDMLGQFVRVRGEITFVDDAVPEGTFVELTSGACRVGGFIQAHVLSEFGAEAEQLIKRGQTIEVEGQLSTYGGDFEIHVDLFAAAQDQEDSVAVEDSVPTESDEAATGETPCDLSQARVGENVTVSGRVGFIETEDPMGVFFGLEHQGCFVGVYLEQGIWDSWTADKRAEYQIGQQVTVSGDLNSYDGEMVVEVLGESSQEGGAIAETSHEKESLCNLTIERVGEEVAVSGVVSEYTEDEFGFYGVVTNYEMQTGYYTTDFNYQAGICWISWTAFAEEIGFWPEDVRSAFFEGQEVIISGRLTKMDSFDPEMEYELAVELFGPPQIIGPVEFDLSNKVEPGWFNKINIFDNTMGGLMPGFTVIDTGPGAEVPEVEEMIRQSGIKTNALGIPFAGQVMIRATADFRTLEQYPELYDAIALTIDGEYVVDWVQRTKRNPTPLTRVLLHPTWQAFLKEQVRRLVDAGVNIVFFDAPNASAYAAADSVYNGDFHPVIMEAFREYLWETYSESELGNMGITDIENFNYKDWLIENGYADQVRSTDINIRFQVPLWDEFYFFLVDEETKAVADLLIYTRDYIDQQGRQDVAITLNVNDFHQTSIPILHLLTYFWHEYPYLQMYPQITRAAPTIRIGNAWGTPSVHHPDSTDSVRNLFKFENTTVFFKTLIAEAFANGSMFQAPSGFAGPIEQPDGGTLIEVYMADVEAIQPYFEFIMANQACCSEKLVLPDVTLVYHAPSDIEQIDYYRPRFREASQALLENNIQYNVLFLNGEVKAGELNTSFVVVPKPEVPFTPAEQAAFEGANIINYDANSTPESLVQTVLGRLQPMIEVDQPGVEAYVFEHDDQLVINLTNRTYQMETETVTDIENITISLRLPDERAVESVQLLSPDGDVDMPLEFQKDGDVLTYTVPFLHIWDVIIIR